MANRIVTATVTGETLKLSSNDAGAAGSFNAVSLAFTFDSAWDGTTSKIVQFLDAYGANPTNITLTSGMLVSGAYIVPIPAEPLAYAGEINVTVRGVDFEADGTTAERIIVCASTTMKVLNSLYEVGGATPIEPTPTQAEQLLAAVSSVTDMTVSATTLSTGAPATVTKTTNVDGTINLAYGLPAGGKGDTGDTGATGAQGEKGDTGNPGAVYRATEPTDVVLWVDSSDDEPSTITKANIGLGNADNTSDVNKPISTATQTALNLKANVAQEAWITPTLINSWANVSGHTLQYRKTQLGEICLKGRISGGTSATNVLLLPTGYRPSRDTLVPIMTNAYTVVMCVVRVTGYIYVQFANLIDYLDLSNVRFVAEA